MGKKKKPKTLAEKALSILHKHGWMQTDYGVGDGPVCLVGAINAAATGNPQDTSGDGLKDEVIDVMGKLALTIDKDRATFCVMRYAQGSYDFDSAHEELTDVLAGWNDADGRKAKDVKDLLKQVAAVV